MASFTHTISRTIFASVVAAAAFTAPLRAETVSAPVAEKLIAASVAAYPGQCACPWSQKRNGAKCGSSSAYSRAGGAKLLCYASDLEPAAPRDE